MDGAHEGETDLDKVQGHETSRKGISAHSEPRRARWVRKTYVPDSVWERTWPESKNEPQEKGKRSEFPIFTEADEAESIK
jgi:hypothetical protein